MYLSAKEKEEEQRIILERQKHLEDVLRRKKEMEDKALSDAITDQEMVDSIFGFLPPIIGGQEGQAPVGFEVRAPKVLHIVYSPWTVNHWIYVCTYFQNLEGKRIVTEEIDIDDLPMEEDLPTEDYDDLNEYSFSKFASMYFQGAANHAHIRQRLRQPLLYHEDEGDVLVLF